MRQILRNQHLATKIANRGCCCEMGAPSIWISILKRNQNQESKLKESYKIEWYPRSTCVLVGCVRLLRTLPTHIRNITSLENDHHLEVRGLHTVCCMLQYNKYFTIEHSQQRLNWALKRCKVDVMRLSSSFASRKWNIIGAYPWLGSPFYSWWMVPLQMLFAWCIQGLSSTRLCHRLFE